MLGVPIDALGFSEVLEQAWGWLDGTQTRLVFTPNPEIVLAARHDRRLAAALRSSALNLADGVGIVWAARRLGRPVPERLPGVDVFLALLRRAAEEARPVFLLGTRPERVERAAREAERRFPGLRVAGWQDGFFPPEATPAVVERIAASGAQLLFCGMGAPKELLWLAANRERLGVPLAMGVGGSLDILAGAVVRAPALWRRLGVEWLWRLIREPRRWRRQLALPRFVVEVLRGGGGVG